MRKDFKLGGSGGRSLLINNEFYKEKLRSKVQPLNLLHCYFLREKVTLSHTWIVQMVHHSHTQFRILHPFNCFKIY